MSPLLVPQLLVPQLTVGFRTAEVEAISEEASLLNKKTLETEGMAKNAIKTLMLLSYESEACDTMVECGGIQLLVDVVGESEVQQVRIHSCVVYAEPCR